MNFKLALAAVAVLGAATTAQAADLAKKAPAAANYVKVCDAYGAGFFYIPGSDTCLKIGGFARAEYRMYGYGDKWNQSSLGWGYRKANGITTRARGEITLDARTATEMGLLRSYIMIDTTADSGYAGTATVDLARAFIQFGGLTAGHAQSMFDFYLGATYESVLYTAASDSVVNLLAYTFSFGNGISATLSIEDPSVSQSTNSGRRLDETAAKAVMNYGGVKLPDVVANVNVTQPWGAAQVMAALHEDYAATTASGTKYGWAVGAGVTVNLPMLAAKDAVSLEAVYSDGAVSYALAQRNNHIAGTTDFLDTGTSVEQTKAWSVSGGFTHYWTPKLSSALGASYASVDAFLDARDYKQIDVQANLVWAPVAGLTIGGEVEYRHVDVANEAAAGLKDADAVIGLLRVQRAF